MTSVLLVYYCVLILLASVVGGLVPLWIKLTHRWMECAVSFVAGIMLGVAVLHLLPHALLAVMTPDQPATETLGLILRQMAWLLGGFLVMFFVERFFCFHHHEPPDEVGTDTSLPQLVTHQHHDGCMHDDRPHSDHVHALTWSGAALGLTLHSILGGVALAASVAHGHQTAGLAGLGTFLVIFLHKPFDSLTLGTLMAKSRWSVGMRSLVNGLFALAVPLGAALFQVGVASAAGGPSSPAIPPALAFSAGVFLCIAMSDLLPELQFHHHDRFKLSAALVIGLGVAWIAGQLEYRAHQAGATTPASSPAATAPRQ